ncbi:MAG: helix-hairpin-helix domain-containing protein [Ignavibacteriales bacterium]|nr:MAG: helix-hairpin-helix domain-containing protein [Ignavibacteriales bacterium]
MFRKLSVLFGLTETEIKVLFFLAATFILGFCYKTFFQENDDREAKFYDYSKEDSLFFAAGNDPEQLDDENQEDISVDYKQEVLDFNESNFNAENTKETPAEKSINLNSASIEQLTLLTGIGRVTAERIIEIRNRREKFNSLNELLEVKGIGETKFQNIIKYLYIE